MQLKYDANKKIVPLTSDAFFWTIEANGAFGIPADAVNTPERFYFTLPTFEQQGYGPELEKAADVSKHPVLGQFPSFFMRNSASGNRKYVIVTKNHQLPFVKVTRGQYLDALGAALVRRRASELKRLTEANRGRPEEVDTMDEDRRYQHGEAGRGAGRQPAEVPESAAGDGRDLVGPTQRDHRERARCVRGRRRHAEAVDRLRDRPEDDGTLQDRRAPVDRHFLDGAVERPGQPEPAPGHAEQFQRPVPLRLLLRSRQSEGAAVQAPPIPVRGRGGHRREALRSGDEECGGSCRALLRRLLIGHRRQEAAQLEQHAGQHRRLERRHGVEGTGRSLGVDGRHAHHAHGTEDAFAA